MDVALHTTVVVTCKLFPALLVGWNGILCISVTAVLPIGQCYFNYLWHVVSEVPRTTTMYVTTIALICVLLRLLIFGCEWRWVGLLQICYVV